MYSLIYLHGFLSSPQSHKAEQTAEWLAAERPDIQYHCPFLQAYPGQARQQLEALIQQLAGQQILLMGSSLGGYWATYLAETYNLPAVLINPAVKPSMLLPEYLNKPLQNYHTSDTYVLTEFDVAAIKAVDKPVINRRQNYWLLVQTGDETLDYREAVMKYQGCRQTVEKGGDHAFQHFEKHIPAAIEFLTDFYAHDR